MAIIFANPAGSTVGFKVVDSAVANIVTVTATKVAPDPIATISNIAAGLGGTANGAPGTITEYLGGLGVIVGLSGSFQDNVSIYDGRAIYATKGGLLNTISISGLAFHRSVKPSSSGTDCNQLAGHGIERILAYFEDFRMSNNGSIGRWTVIKIGETSIPAKVHRVTFEMLNTEYNLWSWSLNLYAEEDLKTGSSNA